MTGKSKPTHNVTLSEKGSKRYAIVGVAWEMEWGMNIVLNPGAVLDWRMNSEGYYITIRPIASSHRGTPEEEQAAVESRSNMG